MRWVRRGRAFKDSAHSRAAQGEPLTRRYEYLAVKIAPATRVSPPGAPPTSSSTVKIREDSRQTTLALRHDLHPHLGHLGQDKGYALLVVRRLVHEEGREITLAVRLDALTT